MVKFHKMLLPGTFFLLFSVYQIKLNKNRQQKMSLQQSLFFHKSQETLNNNINLIWVSRIC